MSNDNKVECSEHGKSDATYLCHHLLEGEKLGFNVGYDPDEPDALYPDAWCDQCEKIWEQEGGWNDRSESFADIKVVCTKCYCKIRERNWKQDDESLHELISTSFSYLETAQESFIKTYNAGDHDRWDWYQETGKLVFSHEGEPIVECDIDFVGSYSSRSNTWMWAWANNSYTENIKEKSREIRALGEEGNFLKLASALWDADEADGWEMTAIMAKELGAIGAYRTENDNRFVYMIVRSARWLNKSNILSNVFNFLK